VSNRDHVLLWVVFQLCESPRKVIRFHIASLRISWSTANLASISASLIAANFWQSGQEGMGTPLKIAFHAASSAQHLLATSSYISQKPILSAGCPISW
jgi:hypothetical protein